MFASFSIAAKDQARIALIIDDMGRQKELSLSALQLPGAVTYSFLPFTPHTQALANLAHRQGKELMLHAPMQAIELDEREKHELSANMSGSAFERLFIRQLQDIPYIAGINNHKGSLLTQNYPAMTHIMQLIKAQYGDALFFVDSKTAAASVAQEVATDWGLATLGRDVFLDHDDPNQAEIRCQFRKLIALALRNGSALGIAHPRVNTLAVLQDELHRIAAYDVKLVSVSELAFTHNKKMLAIKKLKPPQPTKAEVELTLPVLGEYDIF
ncbi:MAG: divergent polysaccharide deacetylase family protein [Methyloprofundus sp.]|nr:divergent polysaccharide deacetylase family protein [Methyloprofundus sp.]